MKNKAMPPHNSRHITLETFQSYRPLLFSIAYRMVGTATEAEDILQEAYLRSQRNTTAPINKPKSYLTTIVTRLCLNHLNAAHTQRESYLGPWLPEPVLTADQPELVNPSARMITVDSISIAFLVLLESLSPAERAVFLLREVFDYSFREIAQMVDKNEAACRQLFHRAKEHIAANRPRFTAEPEKHERLLNNFIKTVETGEIDRFLEMLVEDIALVPDGGGQRGAAIHLVKGRDAVSAFILGTRRLAPADIQFETIDLNGQKAILARTPDNRPFFALFIYSENDRIKLMHVIAGRKLNAI